MKYKAVFFDRDNTLTQANPEIRQWRDETIRAWSGKPFAMDYDKTMSLFNLAAQGREPWYRKLEDERAFFRRYYRAALAAQGVCAEESLYVDDYKPEADGARELGFTAFLIDRNGKDSDAWSIRSLKEMVEYVEKAERETHA